MKSITSQISESLLSEAREVRYQVSVLGVNDSEGMPVTITILCPREDQKAFEQWLEKEEGNTFEHAMGGNIEY